jgi:hypothetical protein
MTAAVLSIAYLPEADRFFGGGFQCEGGGVRVIDILPQ